MTATSTSSASTPRRRRARSTSRPAATSPSTADCCSTSSRPRTAATRRGSTSSPSASSSSPAASPPTVRPATRPPPTSPPPARRARPTRPPDHHRGPAAQCRPRARRLSYVSAMTTTTTSRHETATGFLAALAATAGGGELLELRYRLEDGQRMGQVFDRPDRLRGLATRAIALGRRTDVYFGCAPRTRRHGGRDAVERAFVLWADCDGEQAVAALSEFEPRPAIVIASGTGSNCHTYWPLTEPLPRDEVEAANRRLAHALGADPASADAARILRVPGTLSHKHDPPTPVDALRLDPDRRLEAGDVVGGLADPPAPARAPVTPAPAQVRGDDPLLAIAPDVYVRRLLGVQVPRHRKVRCPFHEDRHASLHVYTTAERGWYCFGACRRGGTIYDLAAPLYGYSARGEDFLRLRTELRRLFELEAA